MHKAKSQVDLNDLEYVTERYGLVTKSFVCPQDKLTGKINPHVSQFKFLGKEEMVSVFHVKPIYYEHADSTDSELVFKPMYEVCEFYGNRKVVFKYEKLMQVHPRFVAWLRKRMELINGQVLVTSPFSGVPTPYNFIHETVHVSVARPTIGLTVTTVYPDPNPETTTIDGWVQYSLNPKTWAETRDNATSNTSNETADLQCGQGEWCSVCGSRYIINRNVIKFDTSSIPDGDAISAATLSLYATSKDATNSDSLQIVSATTAANTSLSSADYAKANWGTTSFGSVTLSALSTSAYNDITLNSSGRANISKTGVSHFGERSGNDLNNTTPTQRGYSIVSSADTSGTSQDPKLAVTHAVSGTTVNASVQAATFSVPTRTITGKALISASVQVATFSVPSRTVTGKALVSVNAQAATFTIPAYIVSAGGIILAPSVQTLTFSLPTRTLIYGSNISLNAQNLTFSVQVPTITADWTVSVNPITLTFTLPTLEFVGALWGRTARTTTGADWSRSSVNNDV